MSTIPWRDLSIRIRSKSHTVTYLEEASGNYLPLKIQGRKITAIYRSTTPDGTVTYKGLPPELEIVEDAEGLLRTRAENQIIQMDQNLLIAVDR